MFSGTEVLCMEGQQPSDLPNDGLARAGLEPLYTGTAEAQKRLVNLCRVCLCIPFTTVVHILSPFCPCTGDGGCSDPGAEMGYNSPHRTAGQEKRGPRTGEELSEHLDETGVCERERAGGSIVPVWFLFPQLSAWGRGWGLLASVPI
ncbi:hypothetical protein KIL84_020476 [Mauremys mutica]|uniref:Uncharacterized protein n=1 Tax=Mauremys mutica TaxID=74926 RepID=A0A9D3XXQ8_9SAUR|nr:hypothetical protein KIL84_020476 [Mauremys mutica]